MDNNLTFLEQEDNTEFIPMLRSCYQQFLRHWWWFAISIPLCVILGWLYQQKQPRVYQRQSVMLIEDSDPSSLSTSSSSRRSRRSGSINNLLELNGVSVGDNLKNEIFILSSQRLMERVVQRLELHTDYTTTSSLHTIALYGNERPFEVIFKHPLPTMRAQTFSVEKLDANTMLITHLHDAEGNDSPDVKARFGEMVNTPFGQICIVRGKGFKKWDDQEISVNRMPLDMATTRYNSEISAEEYDKETSLIVLSCSDIHPKRATDILNTLFEIYKEDVVENKNRVALNTGKFIDQRIELISHELGSVETKLADFKRQNNIVDFSNSAKAMVDQTAEAREKSLQIETQINVAHYLDEYLAAESNEHDLIPALGIGDAAMATQISDYNKLMNTRNQTLSNSSEKHVIVAEFDRQLSQMRQAVRASVKNYVNTLQLQLQDARSNEAQLSGKISGAPEQEKRGLDIQRQQSLKEALYTYLLNKREEVALQQAINEANVRVVEGPLGGKRPISPRTNLILLIGFLVGVVIPAIVLYLKSIFDVSIHNRDEVEKLTSIPILGEIPHIKTSEAAPLITSFEGNAPVVEAFRMLRFNMGFLKHSTHVLTITSSTPGQGKSFISTNISLCLSMAKKRILLIDADIRKQTISKHNHGTIGLTSFLADEYLSAAEIIQHDSIAPGIDFISAGPLPPNPSELLMSSRFDTLISELREQYDHIIIDTTPLFAVADANIVNRVSDITLFVIRMGMQNADVLPTLEQMYTNKRLQNLFFVLNDTDSKSSHYGYGYGYGYVKS